MTWCHPSTHPPTKPYTHPWVGSLQRFQIFKWNWNILISSSVIEFWLISRVPHGGWGDGWMGVWVVEGFPHAHAHACTCLHVHACVHAYGIIGNSQGFPQWGLPFAIKIIMFNMYMCIHACTCMCTCVGGTSQPPHTPNHPPPSPRVTGSPKHQNSISLELIKIFRFCLKILYLWTLPNSYRQ